MREREARLDAIGVDHLTGDHLKMTLLLAVPTADVAAIKSGHDGIGWLRRVGGTRLHNGLANPQRPVPNRAGVRRPAGRKQLRQQGGDLAERCQRRIARRHIRQFRRHSRRFEVEHREALGLARSLAGTGGQPPDPNRHVAEQRAERRVVMALAGQDSSTGLAPAATLAKDGYLRRGHRRLERGCELLRLRETEPKIGQAELFTAFETSELHLR